MNCPRCGEKMYGSVCPRCGNVVVTNRTVQSRHKSNPPKRQIDNRGIKYMDSGTRPVRPSAKKQGLNSQIYKLIIVVLAVTCVFMFFLYNSAKGKLDEAQGTITSLNDSIKAKDEEIVKLKEQAANNENKENNEKDEDSSAPSVEFDENGNVINITDNSSSDSDSEEKSEDNKAYKSGDTYIVKNGDTGMDICKAIYGKYTPELWDKILKANDMTNSSQYYPGDELKVP